MNKRKIQNKLKSLFASVILGFRPAAKRASRADETDATDSPPAPKRCHMSALDFTTDIICEKSMQSGGQTKLLSGADDARWKSRSRLCSSLSVF